MFQGWRSCVSSQHTTPTLSPAWKSSVIMKVLSQCCKFTVAHEFELPSDCKQFCTLFIQIPSTTEPYYLPCCLLNSVMCFQVWRDGLGNSGECRCLVVHHSALLFYLCHHRSEQMGGDWQQWCFQTRDAAADGAAWGCLRHCLGIVARKVSAQNSQQLLLCGCYQTGWSSLQCLSHL